MTNYEMKFGVSWIARLLDVNRNLVKTWAYHFSDYLMPPANPPKGIPRQFGIEDLRVLTYVSVYWEDDPDFESIKCGLNSGEHFEDEYKGLISQATPIFQELPNGLNEDWRHGSVIGGMWDIRSNFALADSYKLAGDMLVDAALSKDEADELLCPVIFNYRHATELYMKAIITKHKKKHDLLPLLQQFKDLLREKFNTLPPDWFVNMILAFNDFDPGGTTFRYGGPGAFTSHDEAWVDLEHVKKIMGWLAESFQRIRIKLR